MASTTTTTITCMRCDGTGLVHVELPDVSYGGNNVNTYRTHTVVSSAYSGSYFTTECCRCKGSGKEIQESKHS